MLRYNFLLAAILSLLSLTAHAQYPVRWTDLIGATNSNNILSKTSASSWTTMSGTSSNVLAPNTDGWIQFAITTLEQSEQVGFVTNNFSGIGSDVLANGMGVGGDGTIYTYEGATGTTYGAFVSGDVFKISREGSQMKYYKNGTVIRTVTINPALQLWVRSNIYYAGRTSPAVTASFDAKVLIRPVITGTSAATNTGSISLNVEGGRSPYTYSWSSGETTSSISSKPLGNYTVTVTDADSRTATSTFAIGYKVAYTQLYNASQSGGVLTMTGGSAWTAGADASNRTFTDAWLEFVATDYSSTVIIGIGSGADLGPNSFRNAIMLHSDHRFYVYESTSAFVQEAYRIGDVFRISRESGNIKYYKNGVVFRTVTASTNTTFIPKTSIGMGSSPRVTCSVDARVGASADVKGTSVANGTGSITLSAFGGVAPYTYAWTAGNGTSATITNKNRGAYTVTVTDAEGRTMTKTYSIGYNMIYADLVNATETNGIVTKTSAGWNGGGSTSNILAVGATDGYFEWVVPQDPAIQFMVGAQSISETGWTISDLKIALGYHASSNAPSVIAYEGGGQYAVGVGEPGDVMRIERTGGTLYYKLNGTVLRSIAYSNIEWRIKVSVYSGSAPRITSSFDARPLIRSTVTGTLAPDNTAAIATTVVGGKVPYSYSWNSGETTASISNKSRGTYTLTVTDAEGRVSAKTFKAGYYVGWSNPLNVTQGSGNTLTKTSAAGWNAMALGTNIIPPNTDGWLEFVVDNSNSSYAVGFSSQDAVTDPTTAANGMRFAIILNTNSSVSLNSSGINVGGGAWMPGDVFRIAREGGNVVFYRNGASLSTATWPVAYDLKPKVAIYAGSTPNILSLQSSTILPVAQITGTSKTDGTGGIDLATSGGYGGYTYSWTSTVGPVTETTSYIQNKPRGTYTVTITDGSGASVQRSYYIGYKQDYTWMFGVGLSGNGLIRTAAGTGWLQGANSYNVLPANTNGFLEVVAQDMSQYYAFGFGNKPSSHDIVDFKNAFTVNGPAGTIGYYEGSTTGGLAILKPGDVLRISREGSNIVYYRNGVALRTIATNPVFDLYLKVEVNAQSSPPIVSTFDTAPVVRAQLSGGAANDPSCSAVVTVEGGTAPYQYLWSTGETLGGIAYKPFGNYTLTVTDAEGRQVVRTYGFGYKNYLTDQLNLVPTGGSPGSYNGTANPSGANSSNIIPEGATNDWIEWVHQTNMTQYQIGFGANDFNFGPIEFLYSLSFTNTGLVSYFEGSAGTFFSNCQPGDVFRIARESGNIKYYRNGVVIRTLPISADFELRPKFFSPGGTIPPVIVSRDSQILPIAVVTGTGKNNSGGSIVVTPIGGSGVYSYGWGAMPGVTNTQSNQPRGTYTVTVYDNEGRSASRTYQIGYRPKTQNTTNVSDNTNTYSRTGSIYDGGATSSGFLPANTSGWIEMVLPLMSAAHIYRSGFSYADGAYTVSSIRHGFEFSGTRRIYAVEYGNGGLFGNILPGDVLRIERTGSNVNYLRNGVVKRTVPADPTLELHWKVALATGTAPKVNTSFDSRINIATTINGVTSSSSAGDVSLNVNGGTSGYTYAWTPNVSTGATVSPATAGTYSVTVSDTEARSSSQTFTVGMKPLWSLLSGVNVVGQTLVKTAAAGWNSGALTTTPLAANTDGWVEFTIPSNTDSYIIGLTTTYNSFLNNTFKHGILVDASTSTMSTLADATTTYLSSYQIGDVMRIERTGSTITYKRNGASVRTTTTTPSVEVRVKAAVNVGTVPSVTSSFEVGEASNTVNNWVYLYKYDERNRMIAKKIPGADWVYMVYDNRDRLVLTQDGAMRASKQWMFTKYDELNRVVITGVMTTPNSYTQQDMTGQMAQFYTNQGQNVTYGEKRGTTVHGYTDQSYPPITDPYQCWTVTYYDDYDWITGVQNYSDSLKFSTDEYPNAQYPAIVEAPQSTRTRGMITGGKVKVLDGSAMYLHSATYYDDKGRIIQRVAENYKMGHDRTTNILDFTGRVKYTKTKHIQADVTWRDKNNMVEAGRLLVNTSPTPTFPYCNTFSTQVLPAGKDGWVEVIVGSDNAEGWKVGFTSSNTSDINYSMSITAGALRLNQGAVAGGTNYATGIKKGERVKIGRVGSEIRLYRNGSQVGSSLTGVNTGELYIGATIYSNSQTITGLNSSIANNGQIIWRRYDHDDNGRVLKAWHKLGNGPEILLAENAYNEVGQLIEKDLHSTDNGNTSKQSVDYRYGIRGWLTSINGSALDPNSDGAGHGSDFFGMDLLYEQTIPNLNNGAAAYNGNVSAVKWSSNMGLGPVKEIGYKFGYDKMNRLTSATFAEKSADWSQTTKFAENVTEYDLNGNIIKLNRSDAAGPIDNLVYNYGTGAEKSNMLLKVADSENKQAGFKDGSNTDNDYTYDANGNMVSDKNKAINNLISYIYPLNLPIAIARSPLNGPGSSVSYIYDATGKKLHQSANYYASRRNTDYDDEFIYEDDRLQTIQHDEGSIALSDREVVSHNDGSTTQDVDQSGITVTVDPVGNHNQLTYLKCVTNGGASNPTVLFGSGVPVQPGELYLIRMKGYLGTYGASPWLKLRIVQPGPTNVDLYRTSILANIPDAESWIEQTILIPANTPAGSTLAAGLFYEGTVVTPVTIYIDHFEIVKLTSQAPEYQYSMKDHLGNVRLTFTTKDESETSLANAEDANEDAEWEHFLHRDNVRRINSEVWDHTYNGQSPPPTTDHSAYGIRLNGTANERIGLAKSFSVMPGDVIKPQVWAKYYVPPSSGTLTAFQTLMNLIISGHAPAGTFVDGTGYATNSATTVPGTAIDGKSSESGTWPKAYLNWLVFDRNWVQIASKSSYVRIPQSATETGGNSPQMPMKPTQDIVIDRPGYVYIYLSNETDVQPGQDPVEVYFDDFSVEYIKSPIIQSQDYYPFGLTFNNYQRENTIENPYQYNGKEKQSELDLGWLDFGARMYMPEIARWGTIDPLAEKMRRMSPYNFAYNNPMRFNDPDGRDPEERTWSVTSSKNDDLLTETTTQQKRYVETINSDSKEYQDALAKLKDRLPNKMSGTATLITTISKTTVTTINVQYDDNGKEVQSVTNSVTTTTTTESVMFHDEFGGDNGSVQLSSNTKESRPGANISPELAGLRKDATDYRLATGKSLTNRDEYAGALATQRTGVAVWGVVNDYLGFDEEDIPELILDPKKLTPAKLVTTAVEGAIGGINLSLKSGLKDLENKSKKDPCDNCTKSYYPGRY